MERSIFPDLFHHLIMTASSSTIGRAISRAASLATVLALASACAGSTVNSGVAPQSFERAPFYAGERVTGDTNRIAHLPIAYQRGATQPASFDPSGAGGSPVAALIDEMNSYLDSLGVSVRLTSSAAPRGAPPDVRFGCELDAENECRTGGGVLGGDYRDLRIEVGRPSEGWESWFAAALDSSRAGSALLISLELAQYWPRQKGLSGNKEVELGTNYSVSVPWLTALDKPVAVLQLTGGLIGRNGRAIRIGAEGILVRRTNIFLSALGAQALITDEDVQSVRTLRRDDLPLAPLVWQVALRNLVTQLTGRPAR